MNKVLVYSMSAFYLLAGINHFLNPYMYLEILPGFFDNPEFLVAISGFAEIILGLMLFFRDTRKIGSWLIICMLTVFFFTVHIVMVIRHYNTNSNYIWLSLLRLPIQVVLVWWAYKVAKVKRLA